MEQGERAPVGAECARIHKEFLQQEDRRTADQRLDAEGQLHVRYLSPSEPKFGQTVWLRKPDED